MTINYEDIISYAVSSNGDIVFLLKENNKFDTIRIENQSLLNDYNKVQKGINLI